MYKELHENKLITLKDMRATADPQEFPAGKTEFLKRIGLESQLPILTEKMQLARRLRETQAEWNKKYMAIFASLTILVMIKLLS
ncbi:MAG: hypothetical protein MZV64_64735 [Ignavibacteriales bacterium]|nr:hypothetical protein [Ignavibacteriales bacterium]